MFHGPIRLRFDGGWFVAVICLGEELGDGTCDCNLDKEKFICSDGVDEGFCYYLAGIPGLGWFTPDAECECVGSASSDESCLDCNPEVLEDCEVGCSKCSCCFNEEIPEPGEDGTVCSPLFRLLSYDAIKTYYPEILQDKNCGMIYAPDAPDGYSPWNDMVRAFYKGGGIDPDTIKIIPFRDPDEPCRVEVWGACSCSSEAGQPSGGPPDCGPRLHYQKGSPGGDPTVDISGLENGCQCQPEGSSCVFCYNAEKLDVEVLDEWQASFLGLWRPTTPETECPLGCFPPCDYSVLPPEVPYTQNSTSDASGVSLNVADTSYERTKEAPPPDSFEWNPDWNEDGLIKELVWYKAEVFSNAAYFDSGDPETGASHCVKYTLVACKRELQVWEDVTKDAITGKPGLVTVAAEDYPVGNITDWGLTVITNFITDIGTVIEGCSQMPEVQDMPWYDVGQMEFPISYEEPIRKVEENPLP